MNIICPICECQVKCVGVYGNNLNEYVFKCRSKKCDYEKSVVFGVEVIDVKTE